MNQKDSAKNLTKKFKKAKFESVSGSGSFLVNTIEIREALPKIIERYSIKSIVDIGCGDWNWMKLVDLSGINYVGLDIDDDLINENIKLYKKDFRFFDIINEIPPKADLIICRDLFMHLSFEHVIKALKNIQKSKSRLLLATTFDLEKENRDLNNTELENNYGFRKLNLQKSPIDLKDPIEIIRENSSRSCQNRGIGLWKLDIGSLKKVEIIKSLLLITTFQRDNLLQYSLTSILSQNLENIEVLVLNDGLPNNTEAICKDFCVNYLYTGTRNSLKLHWRMMGYPINIGVKQTDSDIIIISEAEIYHMSTCLEKLLEPLIVDKKYKALCVPTGKRDNGGFLNALQTGEDLEKAYKLQPDRLNNSGPYLMAMYRDRFLEVGGYDERFIGRGCEDGDIVQRLKFNNCFKYVTDARAVHLFHDREGGEVSADKHEQGRYEYNKKLFYENKEKHVIKVNENIDWGKQC